MKPIQIRILLLLFLACSFFSTAGISFFGALLSFFFILHCLKKKSLQPIREVPSPLFFFAGFVGITLVSLVVNYYPGFPTRESFVDLRWIVLVFSIAYGLSVAAPKESHLKPLLWLFIILGAYCIAQFAFGIDLKKGHNQFDMENGYWRATGTFSNPLTLANVIGPLLCILVSLVFFEKKKEKKNWLLILSAFFAFAALFCTYTRGTWISFFISVLAMAFLRSGRKAAKTALILFAVVVASCFVSPSFQDRLATSFKPDQNKGRLVIWRSYYNLFIDNFWVGTGAWETNKKIIPYATEDEHRRYPIRTHAHNELLNTLASRGIFGGICLLGIFFYYIRISAQVYLRIPSENEWHKKLALGCYGAILCLFIAGFTEANIEDNEVTNIFAIILALISWLAMEHKTSTLPNNT